MLQIISGKFFDSDNRRQFDAYTPLYSNYFWVNDIELEYTKLLIDYAHRNTDSYNYIFYYKNQIDTEEIPNLVRTGDTRILQQFQSICIFGFQAIFDSDERVIADLCKPRNHFNQDRIPSELVTRYFDTQIRGNTEEIEDFKGLFTKIVSLSRKDYEVIIKCIEAFSNSLKILNYNFDLAYSMLIYCLETISQNFDGYVPVWNDYERSNEIETLLKNIDDDISDEIKKQIIKEGNFKLSQRFTIFIIKNTKDSFFITESLGIDNPLRRSEFEAVLKNVYDMRSSYAHSLQPILGHLKNLCTPNTEIFTYSNKPYLTYNGLLRLTHHIIYNVIFERESIEKEKVNWRLELPGVLQVELDPSHWISNVKGFNEKSTQKRFFAYLSQYFNYIIDSQNTITECNDLMKLYESRIFNIKKEYRHSMITHYLLYHNLGPESIKSKNFERIVKKIEKNNYLNEPSIELLVFFTLKDLECFWPLENCEKVYQKYRKDNLKKSTPVLPPLSEILVLIGLANKSISDGYYDRYEYWLNLAYLESSGLKPVQDKIYTEWCKGEQLGIHSIVEAYIT